MNMEPLTRGGLFMHARLQGGTIKAQLLMIAEGSVRTNVHHYGFLIFTMRMQLSFTFPIYAYLKHNMQLIFLPD